MALLTVEPRPADDDDERADGAEEGAGADGRDETPDAPAPAGAAAAPGAEVLHVGAGGRRYERAVGAPPPGPDAALADLGYRPLGDLVVRPDLAEGVLRVYRAADGTAIAAALLHGGRVSSTTFLAPLAKDAIVVASDAFVRDKTKRRVFATTVSGGTPPRLEAALRERRATLAAKHGAPVAVAADLAAAAGLWEAWWSRLAGR